MKIIAENPAEEALLWRIKALSDELVNQDNRCHDLDNMVSSVLDLLVDAGYLEDDHCKIVSSMLVVFRGVDKGNPRVEIDITELAE